MDQRFASQMLGQHIFYLYLDSDPHSIKKTDTELAGMSEFYRRKSENFKQQRLDGVVHG